MDDVRFSQEEVEMLEANTDYVAGRIGCSIEGRTQYGSRWYKAEWELSVNVPEALGKEKTEAWVRLDLQKKLRYFHNQCLRNISFEDKNGRLPE